MHMIHIIHIILPQPPQKGGGASRRPPFVESFVDGCVEAGEAADAAKHVQICVNICKMHVSRVSIDYIWCIQILHVYLCTWGVHPI